MKIAWFSPLSSALPLQQRGSISAAAYSTSILLPRLEKFCEIDLFHDHLSEYNGRPVHSFLSAYDRHRKAPYDVFLYHLENGPQAYFSRIHSALMPGVVWFHDYFLSDFGPEPILNSAWRETVAKFRDRTREWSSHEQKHVPYGPQALREVSTAAVKIFSSERDHGEYRRTAELSIIPPSARSHYLPLPVEPVSVLGNAPQELLKIAFCGAPRIECRARTLLEAVAKYEGQFELTWLVAENEENEARELLADFDLPTVKIIPGRSPAKWHEVVTRSTVAVHTLFSVFGQLGPYLNISMMHGVPSIVCNFGQGELLPSSLILKISCGNEAALELNGIFQRLAGQDLSDLRRRVAEYGAEMFHADVIARELLTVFDHARPSLQSVVGRWEQFEEAARSQLFTEATALARPDFINSDPLAAAFTELGWTSL